MAFRCTIPAVPTLQAEDAAVRITRWDFAVGAHTEWHEHAWPYCVVMVTDAVLAVDDGTSETRREFRAGDSYSRPAGVTHDVMNASDHPISFVEVEWKAGGLTRS